MAKARPNKSTKEGQVREVSKLCLDAVEIAVLLSNCPDFLRVHFGQSLGQG